MRPGARLPAAHLTHLAHWNDSSKHDDSRLLSMVATRNLLAGGGLDTFRRDVISGTRNTLQEMTAHL